MTAPNQEDESWPPKNASRYVRSEQFALMIEKIAVALDEKFPSLEMVASVGLVWDWFERKALAERSFFASGKFRTEDALRAYIRQALWRTAANEARKDQRRWRRLDPIPVETEPAFVSPTVERLDIVELVDAMPEKVGRVIRAIAFDEESVEEYAQHNGMTPQEVERLFNEGCDILAEELKGQD